MILAIDQGTTGTTCLVVDDQLRSAGGAPRDAAALSHGPGWVEHDPETLWRSVLGAAAAGAGRADGDTTRSTNQRETTLLWTRRTGDAVAPAIVWQDRRTAAVVATCRRAASRARTGLVPDPYFSATKLEWLLREHVVEELAFGTVDCWLVWKLTSGREHVTDRRTRRGRCSTTFETLDWNDELLALFGVER